MNLISFLAVSFNRRASDGGANFPYSYAIYRQQQQTTQLNEELKSNSQKEQEQTQSMHPEDLQCKTNCLSNSYFGNFAGNVSSEFTIDQQMVNSQSRADDNNSDVER